MAVCDYLWLSIVIKSLKRPPYEHIFSTWASHEQKMALPGLQKISGSSIFFTFLPPGEASPRTELLYLGSPTNIIILF